jgi:MFS family permease
MATPSTEISPATLPEEREECLSIQSEISTESKKPSSIPSSLVFVLVLAAICFVSINNYFCYHGPSAIALQFEEFYSLSTEQFGTLFTIYSAPNVILVFFSGQFIDQFGLQRSSLVFNALILLSMLLAAILPSPNDPSTSLSPTQIYVLLLISRLILGLGGESICACVSTMISRWFSSTNHLNTAMALNQASVQFFGSAAAFYLLPKEDSIPVAQWITVTVCIISLSANLFYNLFDTAYQDYLVQVNEIKDTNLLHHSGDEYGKVDHAEVCQLLHHNDNQTQQDDQVNPAQGKSELVLQHSGQSPPNDDKSSISFSHKESFESEEDGKELESLLPPPHLDDAPQVEADRQAEASHGVLSQSFQVLNKFPTIFWLLLLHISLVSPILYTFTAFGPMYLQETFPSTSSAKDAGDAISLLYMSIMAAPVTGIIIDYIGYRLHVQFFASSNIPVLFILLTNGLLDPKICMVWMGVIFSITESNGMALISLTVPSNLTGTAFGLYACCISIALLLEPAAVGYIREVTGSFALSIWIFTGLTLLGAVIAFFLIVFDQCSDSSISKPTKHRDNNNTDDHC